MHGRGTFVATKKVSQTLVEITSFEKTITGLGLTPSTQLVEIKEMEAGRVAAELSLDKNDEVIKLALLGLADNEPMVYYVSYFPRVLGEYMAREARVRADLGQSFTTYDLYSNGCGFRAAFSQQVFQAASPDETTQRLLRIKRSVPIFLVTSTITNLEGKILEYRRASYRGDRYKFQIIRKM
jgi:GntR family transcriptional regulator